MSSGDATARGLAEIGNLRGKLRVLSNMIEAGARGVASTPPSERPAADLQIAFAADGLDLVREIGGAAIRFPLGTPDALTAQIEQAGARTADLVFTDDACLDLAFTLPDAALGELRGMIENEIAYQCPFETGEALWFWVADFAAARWHVRAAVALADKVAPVLDRLAEAGIAISTVRREAGESGDGYAALPDWAQRRASPATALRKAPPVVMAAAAAVALFVVIAAVQTAALAIGQGATESELHTARAAIAQETQRRITARAFAEERALSDARLLLIGDVAEALPDDTWISNLTIGTDTVEMSGFSPSAARTTEDLARIDRIDSLRFTSPIARNSRQQIERFRLAGALRAGPHE